MTVLKAFENPQLPGKKITVERAEYRDFPEIKWLFDTYSIGVYGFVPDTRIKKYIREGAVHVVKVEGEVVAAAIGVTGKTLWNILAVPEYRHLHLGTLLVQAANPDVIRVKCRPHEGMSAKDLSQFVDPTPFYQRLGFVEVGWDFPKGYFSGKDPLIGKGRLVHKGEIRNIKIMRRLKPGEKAPEICSGPGPKVSASAEESPGPRARLHREFSRVRVS